MVNIEIGKNYNLWELIHQEEFNTSRIKFLKLKENNTISEVFTIRVSSENSDDFNKVSDFILEKLHKVRNILKRNKETLLNVIYKDGETNIIYWESIPKAKLPQDYSYQDTIQHFIKKLQSKNKYSYRKFIMDQNKKKSNN